MSRAASRRPGPACGAQRGWRGALIALVALAVLTGCMAGFVYDRIDWVVSWYVGGLVTLDEQQEAELRRLVRQSLHWHRQTQLPRYVALLEEFAAAADEPVTAVDLERYYQRSVELFDDVLRQVVPAAVPLLLSLSPGQVAQLREGLAEGNDELWEEYAGETAERRATRRTKAALRVLQRFVGRLDAGQRAFVAAGLAPMHDVAVSWLDRRRLWQERFLGLLAAPPSGPVMAAALLDLALDPNQFDPPDYRRQVTDNRAVVLGTLAGLSAGFGGKQRVRLRDKFREYARDLQQLGEVG